MTVRTVIFQTLLLGIGAFFSLATSAPEQGWDTVELSDDSWVAANVYEGQTSFPVDAPIELAIGWDDFAQAPSTSGREATVRFRFDNPEHGTATEAFARAKTSLQNLRLTDQNGKPVRFDVAVRRLSSLLVPETPLAENTRYTLYFSRLRPHIETVRPIPEQISFSTESILHVTDVWQNNDTVIVSFSAPIDADSVTLSAQSIDFLWEADYQLYSLASDTNTADYFYEVSGNLLMITSLNRLTAHPTWLRIGPMLTGMNGEPVMASDTMDELNDIDNGLVIVPVEWEQLAPCETREDVPEPCISFETAALIRATGSR